MNTLPHILVRAFKTSRWYAGLWVAEMGGGIKINNFRFRKTWFAYDR